LNRPGSPLEWEEIDIRGVKTRVWKNAPPTLRDIFLRGRASFAERTFLVYQDERTTFEGFARAALTIAHRLTQEGVRKGDRVVIAMRNLPEWPALSMARFSPARSRRRSMHGGPVPSSNTRCRIPARKLPF